MKKKRTHNSDLLWVVLAIVLITISLVLKLRETKCPSLGDSLKGLTKASGTVDNISTEVSKL